MIKIITNISKFSGLPIHARKVFNVFMECKQTNSEGGNSKYTLVMCREMI